MFDLGAPTRLTAVVAGLYLCTFHVEFAANASGWRTAYIYFNGTTRIAMDHRPASSASFGSVISITTIYRFTAGQYIEGYVWQDSGGDLNVVSTAARSPELGMAFLSEF